jgi:hypothetical protein
MSKLKDVVLKEIRIGIDILDTVGRFTVAFALYTLIPTLPWFVRTIFVIWVMAPWIIKYLDIVNPITKRYKVGLK